MRTKVITSVFVGLLLLSNLSLAQDSPKPIPLTPQESQKLQRAFDTAQRAQAALEAATARRDAAVSDFLKVKTEIIAEHGLKPSMYDLTADGTGIVPRPKSDPKPE